MSDAFCFKTGKTSFASPGQAERAMQKDRWKKGKLAIFICPLCHGYHLGRDRELRRFNARDCAA